MGQLDQQGIPYTVVPGVTAAFAAAAAMKMEYTLPEITQTLILTRIAGRTPVPESENLKALAAHRASMAIYLSIGQAGQVQKILAEHYGEDFICAIAVKVSQPEERLYYIPVKNLSKTIQKKKIKSQALIVVSPFLNMEKSRMPYQSKLYDKDFRHEYRG
jgi:precorrin-4/cobalt-precorrin-4 C11-methyltransferase